MSQFPRLICFYWGQIGGNNRTSVPVGIQRKLTSTLTSNLCDSQRVLRNIYLDNFYLMGKPRTDSRNKNSITVAEIMTQWFSPGFSLGLSTNVCHEFKTRKFYCQVYSEAVWQCRRNSPPPLDPHSAIWERFSWWSGVSCSLAHLWITVKCLQDIFEDEICHNLDALSGSGQSVEYH